MRQQKLGSSCLHAHVQCVAMFAGSALQLLETRPSMCGRGVASAGAGGVNRRRCIAARRLVTVLTAAGLAACAVGPDFKRPATATPAAYRVPEESSASADGVAPSASEAAASAYAQRFITGANPAQEWWTVFASRDLDAVVREAIARTHTLAAAQATVAEAREL